MMRASRGMSLDGPAVPLPEATAAAFAFAFVDCTLLLLLTATACCIDPAEGVAACDIAHSPLLETINPKAKLRSTLAGSPTPEERRRGIYILGLRLRMHFK